MMTDYTSPTLLTRRQQNASYLHQLELPSLPPLSQLLTTDRSSKDGDVSHTTTAPSITSSSMPYTTAPTTTTTTTATTTTTTAAAAAPVYYDYAPATTTATSNPSAEAVAAAAAAEQAAQAQAVAAAMTSTTTNTSVAATTQQDMLTMMDQIAPLFPTTAPAHLTTMDPTTAAAAAVVAAATGPPPLAYIDPMTTTTQPGPFDNMQRRVRHPSESSSDDTGSCADSKTYSFVAIPGTNQRKRPRRKYDEIERLYHCNWPGCTKSYGTLNHLNAHVSMQKHGPKRHPSEFKEMRKEWRRQKKEREAVRKAKDEAIKQQQEHIYQQQQQQQAFAAAAAAAMGAPPPPPPPSVPSAVPAGNGPVVPTTATISPNTFQLQQQAYNQLHPSMTLGGFY